MDLLGADAGRLLLDKLRACADVTVLAASGLTSQPDAPVVAALADHVMLVAQAGTTRQNEVRAAVDRLFQVGAQVTALVLTGVNVPRARR